MNIAVEILRDFYDIHSVIEGYHTIRIGIALFTHMNALNFIQTNTIFSIVHTMYNNSLQCTIPTEFWCMCEYYNLQDDIAQLSIQTNEPIKKICVRKEQYITIECFTKNYKISKRGNNLNIRQLYLKN